jgi:hypothetical protein
MVRVNLASGDHILENHHHESPCIVQFRRLPFEKHDESTLPTRVAAAVANQWLPPIVPNDPSEVIDIVVLEYDWNA